MLMAALAIAPVARAQPAELSSICACLLEAQALAESQGRIDFSVVLATDGLDPADAVAHVRTGPSYAVGRINFAGHDGVDDLTLRRALTLREREMFDVGKLRRSLGRINAI